MFMLFCIIQKCLGRGSAAEAFSWARLSTSGVRTCPRPFLWLYFRACTSCWLQWSSPSTVTTKPFFMPVSLHSQGKFVYELHLFCQPCCNPFLTSTPFLLKVFCKLWTFGCVSCGWWLIPLNNCNPISAMGQTWNSKYLCKS